MQELNSWPSSHHHIDSAWIEIDVVVVKYIWNCILPFVEAEEGMIE